MKFSEYNVDTKKQYEKIKEDNPETVNNVEEQLKKYENLSQAELMQEFIKESKKQKQNGNLDRDKMENIKSTLLPFLNSNQQKQLDYLMGIVNDD
ncbi:MAG: hypothetical protein MR288_05140 [Firmicutes bacterium]|nr:hypothetical protein [Bacillota bacterium]MDY5041833.1 hypothetical protein [Eubacteriales bacterium]